MPGGIIYLVTCRVTGKHYVGQTIGPLARRWKQHRDRHAGRSNRALYAAIQKYGAEDFIVAELERVDLLADLNARELHWSRVYDSIAPGGYNLRAGNGHAVEVSTETRARLGAASKRDWADPQQRAMRVALVTESQRRPEVRAAKSVSVKRSWLDPEVASARSAGIRKSIADRRPAGLPVERPEVKAKISETMMANWRDLEFRRAQGAAFLAAAHSPEAEAKRSVTQSRVQSEIQGSPEARARRSRITSGIWADPEKRARIMAAHRVALRKPETRHRMSLAAKIRANRPGAQARRIASLRANRESRGRD